jgi:hypothetical protein
MKKNKSIYFLGTTILLVLFSCQSHEKEADDDFEFYKKNLKNPTTPTVQKEIDTLIKVVQNTKKVDTWFVYESEIKAQIQNNTERINQLKLNSKLRSKSRKQLSLLEQNNIDLINLLIVYREKEQQQLNAFKSEMSIKLDEVKIGLENSEFKK